jgi:CHASE2 domain-containing sensor protein
MSASSSEQPPGGASQAGAGRSSQAGSDRLLQAGPGQLPQAASDRSPQAAHNGPREGTPETPLDCPYRGLKSFSASDEDAALFFGRDREQELIVANLLASRLTLLYGQSGIGKSSILCVGVVHALRRPPSRRATARRYAVVYVEDWHGDPRETILTRLAQEGRRLVGAEPDRPAHDLPFDQALEWWAKRLDAQILLVLDQFEQYFLHHPPGSDEGFDGDLARAVARVELRLRCLISLREDALSGLDRFKGKIPGLFANRLRLDGLSEKAALEAIRRPIDRYNERLDAGEAKVALEDGLAERVVSELRDGVWPLARSRGAPAGGQRQDGGQAIEPAYLQLVMEKLWLRDAAAGSKLLRVATLLEMGGCEEIVRSHVDEALAGLTPKQRVVAVRAIRYLVTPSKIKVAHTPADLASYTELPGPRVAETLERLSGLRLMRPLPPPPGSDQRRYEVFHDLLAEPMLEWRARFEAQRLRARTRWLLAALSAAVAAALALAAYSTKPSPLAHLELNSIDARFAVRGAIPADRDIAIVDVDKRTRNALLHGREVIALRPYHARVIDRLVADGARAIGVDLEFERRGNERGLLKAIKRAKGRIVLAAERFDNQGHVPLFGYEGGEGPSNEEEEGSIELLERLGNAHAGVDTFPEDYDRSFRQVRYQYASARERHEKPVAPALLSFSVAVAELVGHVPPFKGPALIDYHGPTHTFATVSMIDVLHGRVPAGFFKGKIVLIGSSAKTAKDLHPTPYAKQMPGAEIQANAVSTVRHGLRLHTASDAVTLLLILAFSLVPLIAAPLRPWLALAAFALAAVADLALVQVAFDGGLSLSFVYPLLALTFGAVATLLARLYLARQGGSSSARGAA